MARLSGRLEPFENEAAPVGKPWIESLTHRYGIRDAIDGIPGTTEGAMTILRQLARQVEGVERHASAIRAHLDQISNDAWSREDMKPYLDNPKAK